MKLLIVLLVVINVAVFFLIGGDRDTSNVAQKLIEAEVNRQSMLLVQEVEAEKKQQLNAVATATQLPNDQQENQRTDIGNRCVRVGPFGQGELWKQAIDWLDSAKFDYKMLSSNERDLKATRVLLGSFENKAQQDAQLALLDEQNIEYFTRPSDGGQERVHLGYFLQKELAEKFLEHLQLDGINAYIDSELQTLESYNWIDIEIKSDAAINALRQRWAASIVKITEIGCAA